MSQHRVVAPKQAAPAKHDTCGRRPHPARATSRPTNQAIQRLLRTGAAQAKLRVSQPNDPLEREADRVADEVMRMADPDVRATPAPPLVQRACCSSCAGGGSCEDEVLSRSADHGHPGRGVDRTNVMTGLGSGKPLPASERAFFEPRFGTDLGHVRVHDGPAATRAAESVRARAFTLGRDVVFGAGQYAPGTTQGRRLVAHELVHAVQQGHGGATLHRKCLPAEGPAGPERDPEDPGNPNGHPLVYRGTGTRRSRRPAVGDAQELLNRFLDQLDKAKGAASTCKLGADMTKILQIRSTLNQNPLDVDCRFGPNTEKATLMFQHCVFPGAQNKKQRDGMIGPKTWGELDTLRAAPATPTPAPPTTPPPTPSPPSTPPVATCKIPTNPDRHGSAFNPTTDGEAVVALKNWSDVLKAFGAKKDAEAAAASSRLVGPHLGPYDAFRHCVASCFLAQRIGPSQAEKFGTAHENSEPSSIPFDNQMDLHNNSTGRSLATPTANCEAECMAAVTGGNLRTIRHPPKGSPAPTTCIGASDQPWP